VQKEAYLAELSRYVVLNPVRAGIAKCPQDWRWNSYRAMVGLEDTPDWLEADWLLSRFGRSRSKAQKAYAAFVANGVGGADPLNDVRHQLFLGDDSFVSQFSNASLPGDLGEISRAQRRSMALALPAYAAAHTDRDTAMAHAYRSGGYTMKEIAEYFRVHYMTVSRAVRKHEQRRMLDC